MRQAAGAHHHDADVLRIALHRVPQRRTELVKPPRRRHRMLDHVHRQRHDRHRPVRVGQHRHERHHAVIHRHLLADRRIELVLHQAAREVPGERGIAGHVRQIALAPAFIGLRIHLARAEREGRIGVEEEPVHVIVVDHDEQVRPQRLEPGAHRHVAVEQRRPHRVLLLPLVVHRPERRRVRRTDTTNHPSHRQRPFRLAMNCRASCRRSARRPRRAARRAHRRS